MTRKTIAARLQAGETLFTSWSSLPDPLVAEALASFDYDAVTLDMQHGGHHEDSVLRGVGPIVAAGKGAIVRIPVGRFDFASRALDFGADAVIAPMINSVDDARLFAASVKYPPVGQRSWGPAFAMPRHGEQSSTSWLAEANGVTLAFAMIETRAALAALDGILEVDGIDGVLVGPSDFSIAWTSGREMNWALEEMMEAVASIAGKARAVGKHAAIYLVDPRLAGRYSSMGYRLFAVGSDMKYLALGAADQLGAARDSISKG